MAIEVLPNNRDVVLELDAEKMVRVINNLLSNAIKYGHEDSVITMEVLRNDGVVTIAVQKRRRSNFERGLRTTLCTFLSRRSIPF